MGPSSQTTVHVWTAPQDRHSTPLRCDAIFVPAAFQPTAYHCSASGRESGCCCVGKGLRPEYLIRHLSASSYRIEAGFFRSFAFPCSKQALELFSRPCVALRDFCTVLVC